MLFLIVVRRFGQKKIGISIFLKRKERYERVIFHLRIDLQNFSDDIFLVVCIFQDDR